MEKVEHPFPCITWKIFLFVWLGFCTNLFGLVLRLKPLLITFANSIFSSFTPFRRTALTRMSDSGVPLRHIQAISGHKTLAALERYLGVTEQQKESAISTLDF